MQRHRVSRPGRVTHLPSPRRLRAAVRTHHRESPFLKRQDRPSFCVCQRVSEATLRRRVAHDQAGVNTPRGGRSLAGPVQPAALQNAHGTLHVRKRQSSGIGSLATRPGIGVVGLEAEIRHLQQCPFVIRREQVADGLPMCERRVSLQGIQLASRDRATHAHRPSQACCVTPPWCGENSKPGVMEKSFPNCSGEITSESCDIR